MDIALQLVSVSYGEKEVVRNLSVVIPDGRTTFLSGPSGAGKTTLLRAILGRLPLSSGVISGNKRRFAVVFQEDRLMQNLSAVGNVRFAAGRAVKDGEIRDLLSRLGLTDSMDEPVRALSGGMKRRVAIARAILSDHDALLLDEPFKGLDPAARDNAASLMNDREAGKLVLIVSHDPEDARLLGADNVIRIDPKR